MKRKRRLLKKWGSLCHTHNLNDSHNNIKWSTIIFFGHNPTAPWHTCLILARFLQLSWQKIDFCFLLLVKLVTSQVLCHWSKNNSPMGKVSTKCWIFLEFPDCLKSLCLLYTVWGLLCSRIIPYDMFMSLPANSLMQSAWHVTAYVRMMTPAALITDDTAFKHTGTHHILWFSMKMDVSTVLKLISSKTVKPCLTMSPWIQGTHLLLL